MNDKNSQFTLDEFVKFCDIFLAKAKTSKAVLAHELGIEYTSFSKMYNGSRPIPSHVLEKAKQLSQSQIKPISDTPKKAKIREELPEDSYQWREEITKLKAIQDYNSQENKELRERVAVLEERLKQTKADSEKKIYELEALFAAELKYEIERVSGRLSRGRESNG